MTGGHWRMFEWGRQLRIGAQRSQFDIAQRWGDGHPRVKGQRKEGVARCNCVSCRRHIPRASIAKWFNAHQIHVSTSLRLCDALQRFYCWTNGITNSSLHTDCGKANVCPFIDNEEEEWKQPTMNNLSMWFSISFQWHCFFSWTAIQRDRKCDKF